MGKRRISEEEWNVYYQKTLKNKKLPLLVLDSGWHELFPDYRKTREIKVLEKRLNMLIQKQGQNNQDIKEYEKAKKIIMNNIVTNMTDGHELDSPIRSRKQEKNQRLLQELNDKIQESTEREELFPKEIRETNEALLIECMKVCYRELMDNTEEINRLEDWILKTREELKERILIKQDMEIHNTQMYKYMHHLLGPEILEVFDREQDVWKGNIEENI